MRDSRDKLVTILRWIQWVLGAYSFGVCLSYFLIDVNYYLWITPMVRAQLALAGVLHIYLYLAAIWISVKPQAPLAWAILDVLFICVAIAAAATGQSSISEYCVSSLTLFWSISQFGYVPMDQLSANDMSSLNIKLMEFIYPSYLHMACGFHATVIVANGIIVILFVITAFIQIKQHRMEYRKYKQYLAQPEKVEAQPSG